MIKTQGMQNLSKIIMITFLMIIDDHNAGNATLKHPNGGNCDNQQKTWQATHSSGSLFVMTLISVIIICITMDIV